MLLSLLKTYWKYIALVILTAAVTYKLIPKSIEYKEKIVTQVQERVRTLTKIVVKPDGSSETTIDERLERDSKTVSERESKPATKDWIISTTMTYNGGLGSGPTYGIGVSKRLILDLYGGLYANTDKDIGLTVSYSF